MKIMTCRIGAAGSRRIGVGDHGDDVFIFGLWGVVCVLALPGERRREKRNIRPLVSPGPSTEKSKRRI